MDERVDDARGRHLHVDRTREQTAPRSEVHRTDVEFQVADHRFGDMVGHARRIGRHDADRHAERPFGRLPPAGVDDAVGIILAHTPCIGTVGAVDRNARADRHEAENIVALGGKEHDLQILQLFNKNINSTVFKKKTAFQFCQTVRKDQFAGERSSVKCPFLK